MLRSASGFYAVVQLSSGAGRKEFLNWGIILCCPVLGFASIKTTRSLKRFHGFWANDQALEDFIDSTLQELNYFVSELRTVSTAEEAKRALSGVSGGRLRIAPTEWILIESSPANIIDQLFKELVEQKNPLKSSERRLPELDYYFKRERLEKFISIDTMVSIKNYRKIAVHYKYRTTQEFLVVGKRLSGHLGEILEEAQKYFMRGQFVSESRGPLGYERKLVFIPFFLSEADEGAFNLAAPKLFGFNCTNVVKQREVPSFIQKLFEESDELGMTVATA